MKKLKTVLFSILFFCFLFSPFFIKVRVLCKSQLGDCPPQVTKNLKSINNKNLFQAKRQSLKILKNDFTVKEYSTQLKLPDILLINIIVKKPIFSVLNKSIGKYAQVDEQGIILSFADSTAYPILIKDNAQNEIGRKIDDTDLTALKLIRGVQEMYQVNSGTLVDGTLLVDLPRGIRVIFPLSGVDTELVLGSLRLVYSKVTTDYLGKYSQIDLRFKNPVLQ